MYPMDPPPRPHQLTGYNQQTQPQGPLAAHSKVGSSSHPNWVFEALNDKQPHQNGQINTYGDAPGVTGRAAYVGSDEMLPPGEVIPPIARDSYFHKSSGSTIPDPSSVLENGRTYHGYKDGKYWLPNDATEQDRLDLQHVAWSCYMSGSLAWAPLKEPRHVLDIGTGTGIWAIEFAEKYPDARVTGTDLSLIQPRHRHHNVDWVQEDAEDDWSYFPHPFDYIHLRMMVTSFDNPKLVMKRAFDHLRPGGWIEYQDWSADIYCQDTSTLGTSIHRWLFMLKDGAKRLRRNLEISASYKEWLQEVGFVDIKETVIRAPANPWHEDADLRDVGQWTLADAIQAVEGISLRILGNGLGMSVPDILQLSAQVKKDMSDRRHRFWWTL